MESRIKNSIIKEPRFQLGITLILTIQLLLLIACTSDKKGKTLDKQSSNSLATPPNTNTDSSTELNLEQETALDALDSLQIQMQAKQLYSTFPGIHHECSQSDTSFLISQTEFLIALEELLAKHCTSFSYERRKKLANEAVLIQKEYFIEQCYGTSFQMVDGTLNNTTISTPRSGTWIMRKVLGRRDIIFKW